MKLTRTDKGREYTLEEFNFEGIVASLQSMGLDFTERTIPFPQGTIKVFYIKQLTDREALTDNVIKPLVLNCSSTKKPVNAHMTVDSIIFADDCRV
jgi:hypothetical protein